MILGKYNQSKTITFDLVDPDGVDMAVAATFAAGDVKISKDEGAEANTTNLPTDEGSFYSLVLTATEMSAARIRIIIIDQTGTKVWLDISLGVETYGNASAEHAFDLDTAAETMRGTDNAALASVCTEARLAELAAANLPADIDTLLTRIIGTLAAGTHNPATAAQIAVLTDWINGGRLDLILDIIAADVVNIDGAAMRGTDGANTVAPDNATIAAILLDTDTTIPALIAALNNLSVNDVWDEPLTGATHNVATSAGRRLRNLGDVVGGTVNDASATTSSFISTLTGAHEDHFGDQTLYFTTGALAGMSRIISAYVSATKEVTFDEPFPVAPGNGDAFDVSPVHVHTKDQIADAVWDEIVTGHTINNSAGKILKGIEEGWISAEGAVNDAGATTTSFITNLTNAVDNFYNDATLAFITGALKGQSRPIISYDGTTKAVAFDEALTSAPADTDQFIILNSHTHPVSEIAAAVAAYDMGNGRTIEEALAFLRNKWEIVAGVLTVYDTDDATVLWTSVMTQTAGNPVSASDPA